MARGLARKRFCFVPLRHSQQCIVVELEGPGSGEAAPENRMQIAATRCVRYGVGFKSGKLKFIRVQLSPSLSSSPRTSLQ